MKSLEPSGNRVGIIADDLTSAADGAGPFLALAGPAHVSRGVLATSDAAVRAIDTGSRALPEDAAGQVAARAAQTLADCRVLYKTMDSTLRGHVLMELAGAFRASRRQLLVVAPAFPEAGRVTQGGNQYVHGELVADSAYGADPVHRVRTSRILDLIDPALGPACLVPEDADAAQLHAAADASRVLVLDATTQLTLNERVAQLAPRASCLWAGSPGMAQALALLHAPAAPVQQRWPGASRVLVVVGSANSVSQVQCDALRAAGAQLVQHASQIRSQAKVVCLRAPAQRQGDPAQVLASLVVQARRALEVQGFDALIATGGDTMAALLDAQSIRAFTLLTELEPGFPLGVANGGSGGRQMLLAMKAGGFGGPETLHAAAWRLLAMGVIHSRSHE